MNTWANSVGDLEKSIVSKRSRNNLTLTDITQNKFENPIRLGVCRHEREEKIGIWGNVGCGRKDDFNKIGASLGIFWLGARVSVSCRF